MGGNADLVANTTQRHKIATRENELAELVEIRHSGSIYRVGLAISVVKTSDLELVDQTGIEPVTS